MTSAEILGFLGLEGVLVYKSGSCSPLGKTAEEFNPLGLIWKDLDETKVGGAQCRRMLLSCEGEIGPREARWAAEFLEYIGIKMPLPAVSPVYEPKVRTLPTFLGYVSVEINRNARGRATSVWLLGRKEATQESPAFPASFFPVQTF